MRRHPARALALWAVALVVAGTSACAGPSLETSAPGPGVPWISNLRIEPPQVENGGPAALRFDFRDPDGDIVDVYLGVSAEIKDFTLATGHSPVVISRGRYLGLREGTAEETIRVTMASAPRPPPQREFDGSVAEREVPQQVVSGIRVYEIFVVDGRGQMSNRLRARVTVMPEASARLPSGVILGASTERR